MRKFGNGGLFAALGNALFDIGIHVARGFFDEAGHLYAAVIAQKTLDLARDHGHRIGGKTNAEALVEAAIALRKPIQASW